MRSNAGTLRGQLHGIRTSFVTIGLFRRELGRHWRGLSIAFGSSIAYSATRLAEPWPLKVIFDNVLSGMPLHTGFSRLDRLLAGERTAILALATVAIVALAAIRSVFYTHQRVLTASVGQAVVLKLRERLFAHLQRLSLSFHSTNRTGELLTRLTSDVNMLRELLVATLLSLVSEGVILVGYLAMMFVIEWRVALVAVLVIPVIFASTTVYSGRIRNATRKVRRREGELAARLHEVLSGIHVVQLFTREDDEAERLRGLNKRSFRSGVRATRLEAKLNRSVELSVAAATAAALWFGATQVIAGRLTPGELIVFVVYLQGFYRPLRRISRVAQRAAKATVCAERVTTVLDREPDIRDGPYVAPRFSGAVRFADVHFAYTPDVPVLHGVELAVEPGETIALVGPTGAGKTTLLALVPRLYDPARGAVLIDGRDVREFTLRSLREQIAVVPQAGILFGADFRENIGYGKPGATDREIEAAARAALIHDFIARQPNGYATVVGERGTTLSGGQRQRLAIARALVRDAPIVLLDEPLSALDAKSEHVVLAALERLLEGRTALIVAHKLSTVRRASRIAVVEDGRIVEVGSHDDLLARGGRYAEFYELQLLPEAAMSSPPAAVAR